MSLAELTIITLLIAILLKDNKPSSRSRTYTNPKPKGQPPLNRNNGIVKEGEHYIIPLNPNIKEGKTLKVLTNNHPPSLKPNIKPSPSSPQTSRFNSSKPNHSINPKTEEDTIESNKHKASIW